MFAVLVVTCGCGGVSSSRCIIGALLDRLSTPPTGSSATVLAPGRLGPGRLAPSRLVPGRVAPGRVASGTLAPGKLTPSTSIAAADTADIRQNRLTSD